LKKYSNNFENETGIKPTFKLKESHDYQMIQFQRKNEWFGDLSLPENSKIKNEVFRNLECQLETLAISMELFIKILEQLVQAQEIVKRNKDLEQIILMLRVYTKKQLGFICES
jgi:hypothetical protein